MLSMLHVRIKLVSAIEKISVQFKYPTSHKINFIIEKRRGYFSIDCSHLKMVRF